MTRRLVFDAGFVSVPCLESIPLGEGLNRQRGQSSGRCVCRHCHQIKICLESRFKKLQTKKKSIQFSSLISIQFSLTKSNHQYIQKLNQKTTAVFVELSV